MTTVLTDDAPLEQQVALVCDAGHPLPVLTRDDADFAVILDYIATHASSAVSSVAEATGGAVAAPFPNVQRALGPSPRRHRLRAAAQSRTIDDAEDGERRELERIRDDFFGVVYREFLALFFATGGGVRLSHAAAEQVVGALYHAARAWLRCGYVAVFGASPAVFSGAAALTGPDSIRIALTMLCLDLNVGEEDPESLAFLPLLGGRVANMRSCPPPLRAHYSLWIAVKHSYFASQTELSAVRTAFASHVLQQQQQQQPAMSHAAMVDLFHLLDLAMRPVLLNAHVVAGAEEFRAFCWELHALHEFDVVAGETTLEVGFDSCEVVREGGEYRREFRCIATGSPPSGGYAVEKNGNGPQVALKELPLSPNVAARRALRAHLAVLKSLHHPNIARSFGYVIKPDEGVALVTLEKYATSLHDHVAARGPMPLPLIAVCARQLLGALEYLHANAVLANTLTSSHVVVVLHGGEGSSDPRTAEFKLSDVGLGPYTAVPHGESPDAPARLFTCPTLLCHGCLPTTASDVWSLGAVLFEAATGVPPWRELTGDGGAASLAEMLRSLGSALKPPQLPLSAPAISDELRDMIYRCLTLDATVRPSASSLLQHRLFKVVEESTEQLVPVPPQRAPTSPSCATSSSLASPRAGMRRVDSFLNQAGFF